MTDPVVTTEPFADLLAFVLRRFPGPNCDDQGNHNEISDGIGGSAERGEALRDDPKEEAVTGENSEHTSRRRNHGRDRTQPSAPPDHLG